jgi:uncharacterized linocin/CFP29 family protein
MPQKEIRIFDTSNNPLKVAGIRFELFDASTNTLLSTDNSRDLDPPNDQWGVILNFVEGTTPLEVFTTDPNCKYPGNTLRSLEGKLQDRIDIDLLKLPSGTGGQVKPLTSASPKSVSTWVEDGTLWSEEEKRAVRNIIFNYVSVIVPQLNKLPTLGLGTVAQNWEGAMSRLDIPSDLLKNDTEVAVNLGRDRVWNDRIWSEIDRAVQGEIGRIRVAQKVFPSTIVNNVLPVAVTRAGTFKPLAGIDQFQPFVEISSEFLLTQAQVDGEENMHFGSSLARLAASAVAAGEDALLFLGTSGKIPPTFADMGLTITNTHAIAEGFVAEATKYDSIAVTNAAEDHVGNILSAVANGMAELNSRAQPGPYALLLSPRRYAQTFAPVVARQLQTPGDQIKQVVTGGFWMVNSLAAPVQPPPADIGILVSLGGDPTRIILGTDATTAFTFTDAHGNYHFRVFERLQLVVQDGRAFQKLLFQSQKAR